MPSRIYARNPVIALDYSERHKAVKKELLIDYKTGNIYVVSAEDREVIFDVTKQIYDQMENMKGDNITITIEGIGEINLKELILKLQNNINDSVHAINTGKEANYVAKEFALDNKSVETINRTLQLRGFNKADPYMIPRKGKDGKLEWIEIPMGGDQGDFGSGTGDPTIIPPLNPDNSDRGNCYLIEPVNDKIYLRASRRQKSLYINQNCKVILPRTLDEFSEINWYVVTGKSFDPIFSFGTNVFWENININQPQANSHHVYVFKTWDRGETWFGELKQFNRSYDPENDDGIVDMEYLKQNYYDKDKLDSDYLNKEQIEFNYYDKPEINEIMSWDESENHIDQNPEGGDSNA